MTKVRQTLQIGHSDVISGLCYYASWEQELVKVEFLRFLTYIEPRQAKVNWTVFNPLAFMCFFG